ncbi:MAG: T9SS type A sorting domain-containing protein [Ignavibacteriae bacterium]|nr:T9SS C-terminal target domain-containing protein [Ignavibacteriota bacterium]NOG99310.1 T9SS type A sorting domain-containing protein [Ignavibacteriota bacterium]
MKKLILLIISSIVLASCSDVKSQLQIVEAFPNLNFSSPVDIQNAGDGSNRIFVVEQSGIIKVFDNDPEVTSTTEFLDIKNRVSSGGEMGLLGLAFHPQFPDSPYFYVDYTAGNPRRTVISKFSLSSANAGDPNSEEILLEVPQPYSNHNAGQIVFGPDNFLYISMGDGGSGGDPQNNGQNRATLLGNILRIDIDKKDDGLDYSIPEGNPFYQNNEGIAEEIFAYGLRNVWRFSFDSMTNELWAADVGQNKWEEINIIESGKNYGWRITEGNHCYNPATGCDFTGIELPVWEYDHSDSGGYSITGGYVYHGADANELTDKYVYADYITGNIWALSKVGDDFENELLFNTSYNVSTFGVDEQNELYFASYNGKIYKFEGEPVTSVGENIPHNFELRQNYPNPFNPDTVIEFAMQSKEFITLKVYDLLGSEVSTLVNDIVNAGNHKIFFNGDNLSSGVYIYRLSSNNFSSSKTMTLLK